MVPTASLNNSTAVSEYTALVLGRFRRSIPDDSILLLIFAGEREDFREKTTNQFRLTTSLKQKWSKIVLKTANFQKNQLCPEFQTKVFCNLFLFFRNVFSSAFLEYLRNKNGIVRRPVATIWEKRKKMKCKDSKKKCKKKEKIVRN
jgi:hypothetical protein